MTEWEWRALEDKAPIESVRIAGASLKKGDRVRLRPKVGGDVMDLALDGRFAAIESIEQDYEGELHVCVVLEDDPGSDLGMARQPGHRFFFRADEMEPAPTTSNGSRLLIAGIGNIFFGDDGFGVEVALRLSGGQAPEGVRVTDFGIRGYDLAYALTSGYDVAILVDASPRDGEPGTLYLIEPDLEQLRKGTASAGPSADAHSMDPLSVLSLAARLGELPKRVLVLGCEPASLGGEQGEMGLSAPVAAAVDPAIERLKLLMAELV